jgi:hypothetical protein
MGLLLEWELLMQTILIRLQQSVKHICSAGNFAQSWQILAQRTAVHIRTNTLTLPNDKVCQPLAMAWQQNQNHSY